MATMRTIPKAVREMRERDPQTSVTEYNLTCLVKSGRLPYVRMGKRIYIAMEILERFLNGELDKKLQ